MFTVTEIGGTFPFIFFSVPEPFGMGSVSQATFDLQQFKDSMASTQKYESAFNFMHLQNRTRPHPGSLCT